MVFWIKVSHRLLACCSALRSNVTRSLKKKPST
jgi:hypothetical protein